MLLEKRINKKTYKRKIKTKKNVARDNPNEFNEKNVQQKEDVIKKAHQQETNEEEENREQKNS